MNIESSYNEILDAVSKYKTELATLSDSVFELSPEDGSWSYSEVYQHIFDSSMLSIQAIEATTNGNGKSGSPTLPGKAILFAGAFPPGMRFKVPERLEQRVYKISKAEAQKLIQTFEKELARVYPTVAKADKKLATSHPRLGDLNAQEWLRFTEIHLNHHLKQVHRIHKAQSTNQ